MAAAYSEGWHGENERRRAIGSGAAKSPVANGEYDDDMAKAKLSLLWRRMGNSKQRDNRDRSYRIISGIGEKYHGQKRHRKGRQ